MKHLIFGLKPINDDFHNDSSYCEKFRDIFFAEIAIVDKTRPQKDLICFHVWIWAWQYDIKNLIDCRFSYLLLQFYCSENNLPNKYVSDKDTCNKHLHYR